MSKHLPSMKALQIFEAAARHLNSTNAAIELNLTQKAVGHQIRNLDDMLDAQLFARGASLQRTPAGEAYLPATKVFKVLSANEPTAPQDYDIAIQYGVGQWAGISAYPLGQDTVFPVCSPRLLNSGPRLKTPEDLQRHTIIGTRSPLLVRDDWPFWLDSAFPKDVISLPRRMF